jgi:hypothetical protein
LATIQHKIKDKSIKQQPTRQKEKGKTEWRFKTKAFWSNMKLTRECDSFSKTYYAKIT